jgi:alanine dehydrogenase
MLLSPRRGTSQVSFCNPQHERTMKADRHDNDLMLYLTESDVRRFLPMRDCIGFIQKAFERLASGEALNHPRRRLVLPGRSVLHYMAGSDGKYFGAKIYSSHPQTGAHFLFLLYRAEDARPLAVIEANHLGQIRTGAASGFAARLLARPDSRTVAVIGSGFQARTQLEAVLAVLPIESVRVWSRSVGKRDAFAAECSSAFGLPVESAGTAGEAVRGADILITATNSATPVVESDWVGPGVHINAMGSNQAQRRELPEDLVRRCDPIVVDSREQRAHGIGRPAAGLARRRVGPGKRAVGGRLGNRWADFGHGDYPVQIKWFSSGRRSRRRLRLRTCPGGGRGTRSLLLSGHLLFDVAPGADLEPAAYPAKGFRRDVGGLGSAHRALDHLLQAVFRDRTLGLLQDRRRNHRFDFRL